MILKNKKWYEVLVIILLCIIFSPFILFVLIVLFFEKIVPAPFEYKKYIKSKYYEFYKEKYKIGITHTPHYLLQNDLLENNIHLKEIRKPYGYMCLVDDYTCIAMLYIEDLRLDNGELLIKARENNFYVSIDEYVNDERKYFEEQCVNRKFYILVWREDEQDYYEVFSNEESNLLLRSKGVYFYTNDKFIKVVKEIIKIQE